MVRRNIKKRRGVILGKYLREKTITIDPPKATSSGCGGSDNSAVNFFTQCDIIQRCGVGTIHS